MTLSGPQFRRLCKILGDLFNPGELARLLVPMNKRLHDYSLGADMREVVSDVVDAAEREGWTQGLIFRALMERPQNAELKAFADLEQALARPSDLFPDGYRPQDPFATCFVGSRHPFVDRDDLRAEIRAMIEGATTRVLLVDGGSKTGKTYTSSFVGVLEEEVGGFHHIMVEVDTFLPKVRGCTPEKLLADLLRRLERLNSSGLGAADLAEAPADPFVQATAQADKLYQRLLEKIHGHDREIWLVLDNVEKVTLPEDTLAMIRDLAAEAARSPADSASPPSKLRVLVFGDCGAIDPSRFAPHNLGPITQLDLRNFFETLFQHRGEDAEGSALDYAIGLVEAKLGNEGLAPCNVHKALTGVLQDLALLPP